MRYETCPGVMIAAVCGEHMMVAAGEARGRVPYVKTINETGVWFWRQLEAGLDSEEIICAAMDTYGITRQQAQPAYEDFVRILLRDGYLLKPGAWSAAPEENGNSE